MSMNKYLLEFEGITCPGCISAVKKQIEKIGDELEIFALKELNKSTGTSIVESNRNEMKLSKLLESFEGCCSSCQINLHSIKDITGQDVDISLDGRDQFELIKKQYKQALERIVAKEEVACSEYCVCKTTDVDRFSEFSEAPSFSSVYNLSKQLQKYNYLKPSIDVIDFGSGTGHDAFQIASVIAPGVVTGIDITPDMVDYARKTQKKLAIPNVVFHQSADLNLIKPLSQDIVITNNVFNMLPDKDLFFQQVHEILRPDGIMIIADEFSIDKLPESLRNDPAFHVVVLLTQNGRILLLICAKKISLGFAKSKPSETIK